LLGLIVEFVAITYFYKSTDIQVLFNIGLSNGLDRA